MGTGNVINDDYPLLGGQTQFKPVGLFWNIVKSFAGAGTFALPWAVMNAGLWGGLVGIVLVALLSNYTIRTLINCGVKVMEMNGKKNTNGGPVPPPSYPEIGRAAYGEFDGFWRSDTCGSVIDNLTTNSVVGDIVRIGISAEVLASFPLVANAGFQALETGFYLESVRAFPFQSPSDPHPFFSRNIWTGIILALAVVASLVKNFGLLVSLVGSLTIASTGFVFPQIFYMKLYGTELKRWDIVVQILVIIFGIGMTALGTFQSIQQIIDTLIHPSHGSGACS